MVKLKDKQFTNIEILDNVLYVKIDGETQIFNEEKLENTLNALHEEKEHLKSELKEFEDYVYSDEKILCYTCVNCLKKGIYEVECFEKGKVDVHGSCFLYWKNEVEE